MAEEPLNVNGVSGKSDGCVAAEGACEKSAPAGNAAPAHAPGRAEAERLLAAMDAELPGWLWFLREPLRLGRAAVRYAGEDGVLLQMRRDGAFFAAPRSAEAARRMAPLVAGAPLVALHDARLAGNLVPGGAVYPYQVWVYESPEPAPVAGALAIRPLSVAHAPLIVERYHLLEPEAVYDHLERGWIYGGFNREGTLVGFIGEHDEATMGMLEVFPEFRRRGYAAELEGALINRFRAEGRRVYCHVAPDNAVSQGLQRKLGLRQVPVTQCWINPA